MATNAITAPQSPVKQRRSIKAPSVKTAVIAARANGQLKAHIAKELKISRPTVDRIIEESQVDVLMSSGEKSAFGLMHKSLDVLDKRLAKESETAATYILSNTLFSDRYNKAKLQVPSDTVVNLAISNLINVPAQSPSVEQNTLDVVPELPNNSANSK